jgi:hypothetical protein
MTRKETMNHPRVNYALFMRWWGRNQEKFPTWLVARTEFTRAALEEMEMEREIEGR